ncbi:fatty acid desaturase [Pyruvatibacter mobilis]|uniref:fatty acid desaturase n=1 Tax=Pyruvatibacter mobilis TaxID=1712261 RepID=UPI003BB14745
MSTTLTRERDIELRKLEFEIAKKYIGGTPWRIVAWGLGNFAVWVALWPLVITGLLPLWAGFLLATLSITLSYLPSHEAQHSNIARPGSRLRWLNELVGHVSTIHLVFPYKVGRLTHLEHHAHTNNPELDPDYSVTAETWWKSVLNSVRSRINRDKVGGNAAYGKAVDRIGGKAASDAKLEALALNLFYWGFLAVMAWSGYALEALLLWWLPRHIGLTYIQLLLSWAPHHPGDKTGRYKDTRAFRYFLGNYGALGMEYHIIHHLHPSIPLHKNMPAYREMKPILEERGCDLGGL